MPCPVNRNTLSTTKFEEKLAQQASAVQHSVVKCTRILKTIMLNADSDEIENCTVRRVMGIFNVKLWKFCKAINNICATKQERRSKTVDLVQRPGCSEFAEYAFCRREIWFVYSIPNCSTLLHSFKVHSPFLLLTCPVC